MIVVGTDHILIAGFGDEYLRRHVSFPVIEIGIARARIQSTDVFGGLNNMLK